MDSDTSAWVGRTLPTGLHVLESLGETLEGSLFAARHPSGQDAVLLVPRSRDDRKPAGASELVSRMNQRLWLERMRKVVQLKHRHLAEISEAGETPEGASYLVLEPPGGDLLSAVLGQRGRLPVEESFEVCRQVAAGLEAAHGVGVRHGNICPDVIRLNRAADGRPWVRLGGFGLGPFLVADRQSSVAGYASPEQRCRVAAEVTSDVYSLGALLHRLLSGDTPDSDTVAESVPPVARAVIGKALDPASGKRFQSAAMFARALDRAEGGKGQTDTAAGVRAWIGRAAAGAAAAAQLARLSLGWVRRSAVVLGSLIARAWWGAVRAARWAVAVVGPRLPAPQRLVVGTVVAAVVGVAGIGLARGTYKPIFSSETRSRLRGLAATAGELRDSAVGYVAALPSGVPSMNEPPPSAPPAPEPAPAAPVRRSETVRVESGASTGARPTPPAPSPPKPVKPRGTERKPVTPRPEPPPRTFVSPFLQSHPWAAPPGGKVYYPSTCAVALESRDLVYFTSEAEARARGLKPSRTAECD